MEVKSGFAKDPSLKIKLKRNRASWQQKAVLEKVFQSTHYPDLHLREQLSGMSPRKVQIWFQNRRTKAKDKQAKSTEQSSSSSPQYLTDVNSPFLIDDKENSQGHTLLLVAAALGHHAVVSLLRRGANPNQTNQKGQTALYVAVKNAQEQTVQTLLQWQNQPDVNIREFEHGQSALHICALAGTSKICRLLLNKGHNINVDIRDHKKRTPLHHACIFGRVDIVELLLDAKADANARTDEGCTPLHAAVIGGSNAVVTMLIQRGANVNASDLKGFSGLSFAVREEKSDLVDILLKNGGDSNHSTNEGFSPLHVAVCKGNASIVMQLLQSGADVNSVTGTGSNVLHLVAMNGNIEILSLILSQNRSLARQMDKESRSVRDFACIYNQELVLRALRDADITS